MGDTIDTAQGLYRSAATNAENHDPKTVQRIHVKTAVEAYVRDRVLAGGVVVLTGNPGDGKTHLLLKIQNELEGSSAELCLDANEMTTEQLVRWFDKASRKKTGFAIAINEGILLEVCNQAGNKTWAKEAKVGALSPLVYGARTEEQANPNGLTVVDLNLRNNLTRTIVEKSIERLTKLCKPCKGCPENNCTAVQNAKRLAIKEVKSQVAGLLDLVARGGYHATMRELQAFLSFLIFGGSSCAEIKKRDSVAIYSTNAFEKGVGLLFDEVRKFDPKQQATPLLDDTLWRQADDERDWRIARPVDESRAPDEMADRFEHFVARKRRALFEHVHGARILHQAEIQVDQEFREIADSERPNVRLLVGLLNKFYDFDERSDDLLYLWVGHRYNALPDRYAAARWRVPQGNFRILIPKLPSHLKSAFEDFKPDHVVFAHRRASSTAGGLRVDRALVDALKSCERGVPANFRAGEPGVRIGGFFDRVAKIASEDDTDTLVKVRIVNIDTAANLEVEVDLSGEHPRYRRCYRP